MSNNFEQFQPKVCDLTPDPLPLKKLCPACTPNKSFIAPDWRQIPEETYLDEAACEYKICVTINNEGNSFTAAEFRNAVGSNKYPTRDHLFRSFVQPAIRLILQDTDKLIAQQIICASHDGPAFAGRVANELLQEYDNFDGIFMDLKDDPLGESKDCPDLVTNTVFGSTSFDPEEPISFTQFVLQNISNEVKNPFALELYARVVDFDIDPMQNLLKVLVSIPAFILDSVPDNPTAQEIQQSAEATNGEVEIDVNKFFGQIFRLKASLMAYATYQSYFYQTQDGFLKFKESGSDYYASSFSSKIDTFYDDLKAEANNKNKPRKKRWNIRSNIPSVIVKNADKIRITFMTGENGNPYRIKRVEAKKEGCEYQRICGRNSKFAKKYSLKPTIMNYIAKINEIDTALQARESYPWLDFLVKFTYPLLVVDYGTLNEESVKDSLGECVADNIQDFGGELKDYILNEALSLVQAIAYEFNSKESCQDLLAESEIEKKYFEKSPTPGLDARKTVETSGREESIQKTQENLDRVSRLKTQKQNQQATLNTMLEELSRKEDVYSKKVNLMENYSLGVTSANLEKGIKDLENEINILANKVDIKQKLIQSIEDKIVALLVEDTGVELTFLEKQKKRSAAAKTARKTSRAEGSPYWKEAKKLALEELKHQDGILSQLVDIEVFMNSGEITAPKASEKSKSEPEDMLKRATLCNIKSLTIGAIQCLFSGVTQEAAFKKIVESALKAMDIDVMGFFVQALPPAKQAELRKMAKEKWADMPMPWEEGFSGGSTEDANPYLNYLGTNSDQGVVSLKESLQTELANIENQISEIQQSTELVEAYGDKVAEAKGQVVSEVVTYTIVKGDTLSALAKRFLKDAARWREIKTENNISDEKKIEIGRVITITLDTVQNRAQTDRDFRDEITAAEDEISKELAALQNKMKLVQNQLSKTLSKASDWPTKPDGKPVDFKDLPQSRKDELIQAQTNAQGTLGTALGDIQAQLIDMYIENMMDVVGIDELMSHLDRFPGGQLVQRYLNQVGCAFQGLHNPPIKSFLSTLSFDPCGDGNIGLSFPEKMKDFDFRALKPYRKDFLAILRNKFIEKLETVLTQILVKMIVKLIQTIDDALCKSINAAGQFAAGLVTGNNQGLDEAVRDAFCPDSSQDDLDKIKENLFNNALGKGGSGLQSPNTAAYDCLFQTMNATMSKQEVIGLLTNTPSNMDSNVIAKMSQLVNSRCPDLSPVLGDPQDIKDCFGSMQKFIPPELRAFLKEQANAVPEGPIFDSICLTQQELDKWNSDRRMIYVNNGLDEKTAQELVDKANERALDDLGTVSDMLQKGPEGLLAEAIDDLLKQSDPACETDPSAIVLEDEDLAAEKLDMLNDFFKTIEKKFISDLIQGKHSILNNILVDTHGNRFNKHERRAGQPFIRPNYVDNEEMLERRKESFPFQVDVPVLGGFPYDLDKMRGEFPETVGGRMLQKMKNMNLQYDSKAKNTVVMKFKDVQDDPDYESKLIYRALPRPNPTHLIKVDETFHRKMSKEEKKKLGLEGIKFGAVESPNSSRFRVKDFSAQDMTNEIDYSVFKDHFNVETVLFRNFLMKKTNVIMGNSTLNKLEKISDAWNLETLNFVRKSIVEKPNGKTPVGFNFGADDQQKVTFRDMLYVNPESDPDDMLTWYYNKFPWDKVLGKSATEHPRVHFLDPAVHGGSYLFPKIYIEPATYNGWMGMIKAFIPEMEVCEDVDNGFLQINNIARRAKQIEGSLPIDKRLSQAPECRFEVPYDRQLTPANHGILEGLVIATLRTFGTEFIIRSMPIMGSIRMSLDNYDDSLFTMMAEKMEQEFIAEEGSWDLNMVKSYTYYLLFIEQCVQVAQRQIKDGLLEETPEMTKALKELNRVQMDFPREMKSPRGLEMTIKGASIIGHNADWETYFNTLAPSEYRGRLRTMLPHRRRMAIKVAAIHDSKHHAQVFLAALMRKEMSGMTNRIVQNLRPLPHVWDLKKYALSEKGILSFSDIKAGRASVEVEVVEGASKPSYGTVIDCPDRRYSTSLGSRLPSSDPFPNKGIMFIEKYVRTISKEDKEQVMTVKEFEQLITSPGRFDENSKLSDHFGNATVLNGEFYGTIGVKFGVRLIYVPHKDSGISSNLDESKERVGKIEDRHHIPLASYEHDVLDKALKDIDFAAENMGEDLKCYIDKLAETDDFKFIFETIIKTTTFSSLFGIYSYYNFFESIGLGPEEVEEDRQKKIKNKWKRKIFDDVKTTLKKQFRSTYRSDDDEFEDNKREKRQFDAKWISNLLPDSYLGLDGSVRWWQSVRIVDVNPFGSDGDDCLNDFQKLFKD
jgi:LysM repeat protein